MSKKIAIVEDEPAIRENYIDALRRHGYDAEGYATRTDALIKFRKQLPDLAILDIGLSGDPDGGYELCRELRALSPTLPIIFLTARDSDIDTVTGLRLGADDYLTKDISLPHLTARIAALFRRIEAVRQPPVQEQILNCGNLHIDQDRLSVTWQGKTVELTVTEFWIITALARRPGHVKTRDQLMDEANIVVDATTISTHVKRIRRKFNAIDPEFNAIEAVYGMGYRWNAE
ncbi:proteobacterial dedicated sortase system response regulator [Pseudomonadota bacterium]